MQIFFRNILGKDLSGSKRGRIGQRENPIHEVTCELHQISTLSSRTGMALQSYVKMKQGGQAYGSLQKPSLVAGHHLGDVTLGETVLCC